MRLLALTAVGAALFLWPFLAGDAPGYAPALATAVAAVAALAYLELGARRLDSRGLALLAAIAAVDAALRLAVVTGIGGFSPVFFPILCAGFVFGPSFGFLAGSLSLLVSAIATGGIGPWLPYQVFAAGWVGVAAGAVRGRPLWVLAVVGALTGFGFGMVMDAWDWSTFYRGAADIGWEPHLGPGAALARFGRFYLVTSLAYDSLRAAGNAVLVVVLGPAVVAALTRLRARFSFEVLAALPESAPGGRDPVES